MTRRESFEMVRKGFCLQIKGLPRVCRKCFLINSVLSALVAILILISILKGDEPNAIVFPLGIFGIVVAFLFFLRMVGMIHAAAYLAKNYHGFMAVHNLVRLTGLVGRPLSGS